MMKRPYLSTEYAKRTGRSHRNVLATIERMIRQFPELAPMAKECRALNRDKFVRAYQMSAALVAFMAYWDSKSGRVFLPFSEANR